jgi:uncharacterized membrane protein
MLTLNPLPRRLTYVLLFEALAIVLSSFLLAALSDGSAKGNLPVAIAASTIALVWNFVYNTAFEAWEGASGVLERTLSTRLLHAAGFEGGLVLLLIPLFMWWYSVGPLTALAMEAALLVFFLIFTFVFTWVFDICVKKAE